MKKILVLLMILTLSIPYTVKANTSSASSYILMDDTTSRVLVGKDIHSKRLIASITKIMTATLAIESGKLDEMVVVTDDILKAYGSGIYIEIGEEILLRDLVYGLMLRSGNDAATMIAVFVGGSEEEFINMMNKKANEIGMKDTTFNNPSGLPTPEGNYSSVYDMALLTRYAMQYNDYREIVKTKKYKVTTNKKTYLWDNKNKLLRYDYITGGKTGYTEESGRTLVSTASIDDMNLIVVTIRDSDDWNTHLDLYNYAKENYIGYRVLNKSKFRVYGDKYYQKDKFYISKDIYIPLKKEESRSLVSHIILEKKKDYNSNDKVGRNQIFLGDKLLYEEDIYIIKNKSINKKNIFNKIREWFSD